MKNKIKFIFFISVVLILQSCSEDTIFNYNDVGASARLAKSSISVLDHNYDIPFELYTNDITTINSVEVFKDDTKITDATLNGSTATFNSSTLGNFLFGDALDEPTGAFNVSAKCTLSNGQTTYQSFPLSVVKAVNVEDEVAKVKYNDSLQQFITFSTFSRTEIETMYVEWKKNKAGTYVVDPAYTSDNDSIKLNDLDYITKYNLHAGDTLYYKFTAKIGAYSDNDETSVAIIPQTMGLSASAAITLDDEYNLNTQEYTDGEILYLSNSGFEVNTAVDMTFVPVILPVGMTVSDYFETGDLIDARAQITSGTPVTSITNVVKDDLFAYNITRTDSDGNAKTTYGLIKIGDIVTEVKNGTTTEPVVNFDYKEGFISEL